jgi:acetyl esterase/lipase
MPSEQLREFTRMIRAQRAEAPLGGDVAVMRANMESQQGQLPVPDDVTREQVTIAGRAARWVRTPNVRGSACMLYLHGGGYVMGSRDTHTELMARLARATGMAVRGLDYRLAPENPYPAAVEDAVAAYHWLLEQVEGSGAIVIAGDSAGGGLTMAMLLALKDQRAPLPAGAVLLSPWTDLTGSGDSVRTRAEADPMITGDVFQPMAKHYLAGTTGDVPGVSPLFGDLSGLPPLLIQVGDAEVLLDDSTRLHQRARAAGVDSTLHVFDEAFHVFQAIPVLPEAAEALEEIAQFCSRVTG